MKNSEQLFQQHYLENGAENKSFDFKTCIWNYQDTHGKEKEKEKIKQNRDSLRKKSCCTPVGFPGHAGHGNYAALGRCKRPECTAQSGTCHCPDGRCPSMYQGMSRERCSTQSGAKQ